MPGLRNSGQPCIELRRPKKGAPVLKFSGGAGEPLGLKVDDRIVIAIDEGANGTCPALALRVANGPEEGRRVRGYGNCATLALSYGGLHLITANYRCVTYKGRKATKAEAPMKVILEPLQSEK